MVVEATDRDREAGRLLAGRVKQQVHDIGHLPVPLAVRREALQEILDACGQELDGPETEED